MFGTLRYLPKKKTGEFLKRESGVVGNIATNKPQHSACDNCRVKKIRCSGRRAGCSRCKTLSVPCRYTHVPTRKCKRKQAPSSSKKDNENETCLESSAAPGRSPARDAAATAAVQPSLLTMEPHGVDENYIGLDKAMHRVQADPDSVLDPMLKGVSTWSSCLNWSPGRDGTFMPDPDCPMAGNPHVPADSFTAKYINTALLSVLGPRPRNKILMDDSYSGSENTAQQPPPPPAASGFTPPGLLPTPPLTHILASTLSTIRSIEDTPEIAMEEQSSCSCLNSAVFLLDELESPHHEGAPGEQGLDSILSIYQEVLFLCKRMISCDSCRGKSENMMVLTMVLKRLAILCGEVIDAFIAQREANGPGVPPVPVAMMEKQPLVLGEYEIEDGDYEVMMGVLVTRRLSELESFLARMKMISSLTRRAHQQARMARVDQHIKDLSRKLTSVCPLVTELRVDPNRPVVANAGRSIYFCMMVRMKSLMPNPGWNISKVIVNEHLNCRLLR
ncbi:Zn(II)2Cys6 transcription factor domain-containing protein [Aspergillus clavatus NRRL 1]|uniref:C6 zinc finger domain protein n=1 Tax=Aspergillus clavatus (strain ATCC 1007 / CBS 513.65 / DSM 816 / NCTC 3887 / NRRL 1 / QM 1276 / 107) TaxID=344612 RepID=A1CD17_ASPCL|nr:C6 zinc finger domain protein [Aspergillus clavatus NRRL 1]EAW12424.1 C6 zinc finger domain protein [Aspergillus clavatus NRRL 1]